MEENRYYTMKRYYQFITTLVVTILGGLYTTQAQSKSLQILEVNPDARSVAMGNFGMISTDRAHLYTNPASLLYADKDMTLHVGTEIFPSVAEEGRAIFYNFSLGWRLSKRQAILGGFRYLGSSKMALVDDSGMATGESIKPTDWTLDLGYTFKATPQLALFTTGSFVQSRLMSSGHTVSISVGGNWRKELRWGHLPSLLNFGLKLSDFGPSISYGGDSKYPLPSSLVLGSDLTHNISERHHLTYTLGMRHFFLPTDAQLFRASGGIEYSFKKMVSLRAGYQYGNRGMSHITTGFGLSFSGFIFDFAYKHSTAEFGNSNTILSCGYNF